MMLIVKEEGVCDKALYYILAKLSYGILVLYISKNLSKTLARWFHSFVFCSEGNLQQFATIFLKQQFCSRLGTLVVVFLGMTFSLFDQFLRWEKE